MRVLVVEDDETTQRVIQAVLKERHHEVTGCLDAETALEAFQENFFHLILLDWMLPGMDGLELCRLIRSLPLGSHSVIIAITSRSDPKYLREILDVGVDDYMAKPLDVQLLKVRLEIAERLSCNRLDRKKAELKVMELLSAFEKSHQDLMTILNQLQIGTMMTDQNGLVTFLNLPAQQLCQKSLAEAIGKPWQDVFPLKEQDSDRLATLYHSPAALRQKSTFKLEFNSEVNCWVDLEIYDNPHDSQRKLFYIYDLSEIHSLRHLLSETLRYHNILGKSNVMQQVYQQIQEVGVLDTTVLIEGETGTGKELVAKAIHQVSKRSNKPFIAVNCAGLTDSILSSQLFGHKRGAFTGAVEDHKGFFETADGGTLFLDEIGDISMNVQTNLLRVIQEREILRLGESKPRKINVRIITATHRNLAEEVVKGNFRQDLLYRIRVIRISLPPLRERREDIPLMCGVFLEQYQTVMGKIVKKFSNEAMHRLIEYTWPGNVRELKSAIETAVVKAKTDIIQLDNLPREILDYSPTPPPNQLLNFDQDERQKILAALAATKSRRSAAARLLGISRATFYRRLKELGIVEGTA